MDDVTLIIARFRELREQGHSCNDVLDVLRREGASPLTCQIALHEVEGLGLVEAKRFLYESPAWADYMGANDESLIEEIEAMEPEA